MTPPAPRRLTAVPDTWHVRIRIAEGLRALAGQDQDDLLRRRADVAELRREFETLKRNLGELCYGLVLARSRSRIIKAAVDDPKHPGWPAGTPGGKGGQFRPKNSVLSAAERPTRPPSIGHNQGPPLEDPPEIPSESAPLTDHELWNFAKAAARWLAKAGVRSVLRAGVRIGLEATIGGPVGDFLLALEAAYWISRALPVIYSYLDPPKTWEELHQKGGKGYDTHHNVERWSKDDRIAPSHIFAPDNEVSIPRIKHWEINSWLGKPNDDFEDSNGTKMTPRENLKGKSWEDRHQFGLEVLKKFEVLKP